MREWIKAAPIAIGLPIVIGAASVPPDAAASNLAGWARLIGVSDVPHWLAVKSADHWVILLTIGAAFAYSILVWRVWVAATAVRIINRLELSVSTKPEPSLSMVVTRAPQPQFTPLPDAARRFLEANLDNVIGTAAMAQSTPNERLNWCANLITRERHVPLYGKRPPSQVYELVPIEKPRYHFRGGAAELYEGYSDSLPTYVDLAVKEADLNEFFLEARDSAQKMSEFWRLLHRQSKGKI